MSFVIPELIQGRYRYIRDLGQGGMGKVVLVHDLKEGVELALKWVALSTPASPPELRHHREFQVLSRFRHPNILHVHDYGICEHDAGRYFTCECLSGPPINDVLADLTGEQSLKILVQLLRALALVHAQGWVHGDIKPENLLLREPLEARAPRAVLVDFGLAHPTRRPPEEKILGTVYYMAPERILGARLDTRGDLYSVGVLAYQFFTGRLPFPGLDKMTVLQGHLRENPVSPREHVEMPEALADLILGLLEKKPGNRPDSAEDVLRVFRDVYCQPGEPETLSTTKAYFHPGDECGWEDPLSLVTGCVLRRSGAHSNDLEASIATPTEDAAGYDAMPLLPRERGSSATGMMLLRSGVPEDVDTFRELVRLRVEGLGIPVISLGAAQASTPFFELVAGVFDHLRCEEYARSPLRNWNAALCESSETTEGALEALVTWLTKVATDQSVVFLVDEMERASSSFCKFLSLLAAREKEAPSLRNLTWIGMQRRSPDLVASQWFQSDEAAEWRQDLNLLSLDPEALNRWLQRRMPGGELSYNLKKLLEEESEGSPSLLQRLLCSLVDRGILRKSWTGWSEAKEAAELRRSPLVERTLKEYRAADANHRRLLAGLAAIGGSADLEWLRRVTDFDTRMLVETVAALRDEGWIAQEVNGKRFRFAHAFHKKAVREGMDDAEWQAQNELVARLLQQRAQGNFAIRAERLAHHLLEAGRSDEAYPHVRGAAREALGGRRSLAAIRWLEQALEYEGLPPEERIEFLDKLAELRREWGPPAEVERLQRLAVEASEQTTAEPIARLGLQEKLARSEGFGGDFGPAFQRINGALRQFSGVDRVDRCRSLLLLFVELSLFRGTPAVADDVWALLESDEAELPLELVGCQAAIGSEYRLAKGHRRLALEQLESGVARLDGVPNAKAVAWSNFLLARKLDLTGFDERAIGQYRLAAYLFARMGDGGSAGRCELRLGELLFWRGDTNQAEEYLKKAETAFERIGAEVEQPRVAWIRGLLLARSGWVADASKRFSSCYVWCKRYPSTPWAWECLLAEAEIDTCRGRLEEAAELLHGEAHPDKAPHRDGPEPWVRWGLNASRHALKLGEPGNALQLNLAAIQEVRERGDIAHQVPLWWERWRMLDLLGCAAEADQLSTQMSSWGERYPELAPFMSRRPFDHTEEDLLRSQDEQEIAAYYYEQGKNALLEEEPTRGVFLLEEAMFHAKRVRAQPLTTLIGSRLATVRHLVFDGENEGEATMLRGWKTLEARKILMGRAELLVLWANEREAGGDREGAEQLRLAAQRELETWSTRIPVTHDREVLAQWLGLPSASPEGAPRHDPQLESH